jgi:hypothetical protein
MDKSSTEDKTVGIVERSKSGSDISNVKPQLISDLTYREDNSNREFKKNPEQQPNPQLILNNHFITRRRIRITLIVIMIICSILLLIRVITGMAHNRLKLLPDWNQIIKCEEGKLISAMLINDYDDIFKINYSCLTIKTTGYEETHTDEFYDCQSDMYLKTIDFKTNTYTCAEVDLSLIEDCREDYIDSMSERVSGQILQRLRFEEKQYISCTLKMETITLDTQVVDRSSAKNFVDLNIDCGSTYAINKISLLYENTQLRYNYNCLKVSYVGFKQTISPKTQLDPITRLRNDWGLLANISIDCENLAIQQFIFTYEENYNYMTYDYICVNGKYNKVGTGKTNATLDYSNHSLIPDKNIIDLKLEDQQVLNKLTLVTRKEEDKTWYYYQYEYSSIN